jgi:hypothetical protein
VPDVFRFVARLIRGAVTAAVILVAIVGTPWLLLHFFGSPVPTAVPSMDTVREWFDTPNTSDHLLAVVLLAVWAGWALFTYFSVEVVAAIRGIRAPRLKLATPLHSVAAGLVGATATALTSAAAQAAPPPSAPVTPVATAPDRAAPTPVTDHQAATTLDAPTRPAVLPRYVAVHGDYLSGIANRFLGDPDAYTRIQVLNPDLEQRDPRFPDHIEPGWIINLPADAIDHGPALHASGTLLPPAGTTDPTDTTPPVADQEPPAPAPPTTPAPTATSGPTTPATPGSSPTPSAASAQPLPTVSVYPQPDADADADSALGADGDVTLGGSRTGVLSGAAIVSTFALQVLEANRRRQRRHRRPGQTLPNPRDGQTERDLRTAQAPADVQRLDVALRHLTAALAEHPSPPDIVGVRLIGGDVQLLLAGHPSATPPDLWFDEGDHWLLPAATPVPDLPVIERPVPTLTAIGSRAGRHLLIDLERHGTLTITGHPDRALALLRYIVCELATNAWSEDAEIIVTGFTEAETNLLKQVRPERVITAGSVADAAAQLRRHITATRRALDALDLPDTLSGRLHGVAVDAWTPHVLLVNNPDPHDRAQLQQLHHDLAATGRSGGALVIATPNPEEFGDAIATVAADATLTVATPYIRATTAAACLTVPELEKIAEILRLATVTDLPTYHETDAWPQPTPATFPPADTAADPDQRIRNLYDPQLWADTTAPTPTAAPPPSADDRSNPPARRHAPRPGTTGPDPALDADLDAWSSGQANAPRTAILGRIEVQANGPEPERRRALHTEIATYLALHPLGASQDQLIDAIWPNGVNASTARGFIANVRRWLGATPDGRPWLPDARDTDGRYRLEPGHLLDWDLLGRLRARARRRGPDGGEDLRAALTLVRGRPFSGTDGPSYGRNQYTWLPETANNPMHVLAVTVDTAHQLARHYLDAGDTAGARWAIQQAWTADPDRIDDPPWIDLIEAEQIDGNRAAMHQLRDELVAVRGLEVPEDLPPETYRTIEDHFRR